MKPTHSLPEARKPREPFVIPDRVMLRALARYYFESPTGCHISTYSVASHGYAQVGWQESNVRFLTLCHRAAWAAVYGQIPEGMTIDHLCKSKRCVNVEHLRLLSNFENARRTNGRDWPLGQCAQGHLNRDYLHQQRGGKWICSACMADARQAWNEKQAAV